MNDQIPAAPARPFVLIPLCARDGSVRDYAVVDAEDAHLADYRWSLSGKGYVERAVRIAPGRYRHVKLHRVILGLGDGDPTQVDHIDRDPLNCRRSNLRLATNAQNHQNRGARRGSASGLRGVARHGDRWRAMVTLDGERYSLGVYDTTEAAAAAAAAFRAEHMPYSQEAANV